MNPGGPIEEAGTTARSVVSALASTPVVLALVLFNVLYLATGAYTAIRENENRAELLKTWAHEHETTAQLLASCIPAGTKLQSDQSIPLPRVAPLPKE